MAKTTKTTKTTKTSSSKGKVAQERGTCIVTGVPTSRPSARFAPGMDARLKSMLLKVYRGEAALSSIPKAALAVLRENGDEGIVGFALKGDKLKHIGHFSVADKSNTGKAKARKELSSKEAYVKKSATTKTAKKNKAARKAKLAALATSAGVAE